MESKMIQSFFKDEVSYVKSRRAKQRSIRIEDALSKIIKQLELQGRRPRTLNDYTLHMTSLTKATGIEYVNELNSQVVYDWLLSMDGLQNSTKLIRLKGIKAVLNKFLVNGYLDNNFWSAITIKVDKKVKPSARESDVMTVVSNLDINNFIELRDAVAILLMYKAGLRIGTLSMLEIGHLDFANNELKLSGDIMKNHNNLRLPIPPLLCELIEKLHEKNNQIRLESGTENNYLIISKNGTCIQSSFSNNVITKRLKKYADTYQVSNLNPHALRRGFATNLLKKGANVTLISKALGHSDLSVTTQYLSLEDEEIVTNLRNFL